jgi:AraC family transcriptional regulator
MSLASRMMIEEAVLYIEENLKDKLSLDDISDRLCISKYHLHRLFRAITGMPLISYVRGRKLTSSLTELMDDKLNIIGIAYEYDFQYEQTYVRAFKQLFKITPSFFRQNQCEWCGP